MKLTYVKYPKIMMVLCRGQFSQQTVIERGKLSIYYNIIYIPFPHQILSKYILGVVFKLTCFTTSISCVNVAIGCHDYHVHAPHRKCQRVVMVIYCLHIASSSVGQSDARVAHSNQAVSHLPTHFSTSWMGTIIRTTSSNKL